MLDMQEFWVNRNAAKNELAVAEQEKQKKISQVPQGVQELFNIFFRLQPRHENKPNFNAYQAQFQLDDDTIQNNQKIQDIIGHTFLGMAIAKSSDTMAALDLVMEPSFEYKKEINSIENIVNENLSEIKQDLEDNKSEREITESFKDLVLDSFDDELTKPKFVKDLLATMDDKDWYHLALQFVQINQLHDEKIDTLKESVRQDIKTKNKDTKFITKEEGEIKLQPLRMEADQDLKATEDEIVIELLKQYKPVLRANKVLEFRRMNIMLNWFNNNIELITNGNPLPSLDDDTKQELDELTADFSNNIADFVTDPKSEKSKQESRQYLLLSKQVYNKFGSLMKQYIKTPEAVVAISQGLEEVVNKKDNSENVKLIVQEFLRQFEALKN